MRSGRTTHRDAKNVTSAMRRRTTTCGSHVSKTFSPRENGHWRASAERTSSAQRSIQLTLLHPTSNQRNVLRLYSKCSTAPSWYTVFGKIVQAQPMNWSTICSYTALEHDLKNTNPLVHGAIMLWLRLKLVRSCCQPGYIPSILSSTSA